MSGPFDYITGIPAATNNPSADQPRMQKNFNSINSWTLVDHIGFADMKAGYHNVIHFDDKGVYPSTPGALTGVGQLYTNTVAGDQQLFYESGAGKISQLTPLGVPSIASTGYAYIAGGLIIQWGFVPQGMQTILLNFPLPFPSANPPFSMVVTPLSSSLAAGAGLVSKTTPPTATQYAVIFAASGSVSGAYWIAIGN